MPITDYLVFQGFLFKEKVSMDQDKERNSMFYFKKKCKDLSLDKIDIKFEGLEFSIPSSYWLRSFDDYTNRCYIMIKSN